MKCLYSLVNIICFDQNNLFEKLSFTDKTNDWLVCFFCRRTFTDENVDKEGISSSDGGMSLNQVHSYERGRKIKH